MKESLMKSTALLSMIPHTVANTFPLQTPSVAAGSPSFLSRIASRAATLISATPIEGVAFLVASAVVRIFSVPLSAPLLGIGLSFIATRLVLKMIDCYDPKLIIHLKIEAYILIGKYPELHKIAICFALAISFLSTQLGFISGAVLGSFVSVTLDVENYKLIQKSNRGSSFVP
jgi:hypothetical protein